MCKDTKTKESQNRSVGMESAQLLEQSARSELKRQEEQEWSTLMNGQFHPRSMAFLTQNCVAAEGKEPKMFLLVVDGIIYDATSFAPGHKAGANIIKKNSGKECGETFNRIHSGGAKQLLKSMEIGPLYGAPANKLLGVGGPAPAKKKGFAVLSSATLSANTKAITFATPKRLALPAGGHVMVTTPKGSSRSYTPYIVNDTSFTMMVKRYPNGEVSSFLHQLKVGDYADVSEPMEPMVAIQDIAAETIVMVAGGTGVAPLYSMAEHVARAEGKQRVIFFACFRNEADALLQEELAAMNDMTYGRVAVHFVFSQADLSRFLSCPAFFGRFSGRHLEEAVQTAGAAIICGPPGFGESASKVISNTLPMIPSQDIFVL